MTLFLAWFVLPVVLAVLSLGCGLLLEAASGMRLPGALLLPGGFIVMSLAAYFAHMTDTTASLQTPLVVALAVAGFGISRPWHRFQFDRWLTGAAVGVYWVFAAPVVLFGPTFAGYIKLDDTAAYMAALDRAQAHAYNSTGVPYSTYLRVLQEVYNFGYPLGSLLPLDVGHTLLGVDPLWLWQPYLTFLAVLTALGLYQLVSGVWPDTPGGDGGPGGGGGGLVQSPWLRACIAFFGAQAALIYGYAMWGGVKELFSPGVLLFAACLVPRLKYATPRQVIPLAAASAAIISGLSVGGGVWLVPCAIGGVVLLVMTRRSEDVLKCIGVYLFAAGFLAIPILSVSLRRLHHIGKFTKSTGGEIGNLIYALSPWHVFGIWPSGDFRGRATNLQVTEVLCLLVAAAVVFAIVTAWRRRRWEIVLIAATAGFACLVYVGAAVPWVAGKALASSSPLVLGVGLAGAAVVYESGRRLEGGVVLAALAAGVLWSNVMQYHGVFLAPSARLMELEKIGQKFSGQGPALLTEYEPYAARHFLRGLDAEATSELRVHYVYLRGCKQCVAPSGSSPDIDQIKLNQLIPIYHTLIIRRTGAASRPPSAYKLVWSGQFYDVWQQHPGEPKILEHMSLGSQFQPAAVPKCSDVMSLAHLAAQNHGVLATVYRPRDIVIPADVKGTNPYTLHLPFTVPTSGTYGIWVGGSFSSTLTASVDGVVVGQGRNELQWYGNFLNFGSKFLKAGKHELVIHHSGPDWGPGSAAIQPYHIGFGLGPFVIAQGTDDRKVVTVKPSAARSLCGKSLDWIEALSG